VLASDTAKISSVTFFDGARKVATAKTGVADLYGVNWKTAGLAKGRHVLRAVIADKSGGHATASRAVRIC